MSGLEWTDEDSARAREQGWDVPDLRRGGRYMVSRKTIGMDRWPTRDACQEWVVEQAQGGDPTCAKAFALFMAKKLVA